MPFPQGYAQCAAKPRLLRAGHLGREDGPTRSSASRGRCRERNKIAIYNDRALRLRGHAMGALTDPRTASVIWNTPTFATGSAKWTSTLSSKLLLEVGTSFNRERYDNLYQPGILAERNTPAWYKNVRKDDTSTGLLWNASSAQLGNYPDRYNVQGAMSYVTGAHNVKGGIHVPVRQVPPLQQRERRPLPDLPERRAAARDRAQHAARSAGEPQREHGRLRPGFVEPEQADAELRHPLGLPQPGDPGPEGAGRPLRERRRLREHRPADVERHLAPRLGGLRLFRQRQDGHPRRLQQVRGRRQRPGTRSSTTPPR